MQAEGPGFNTRCVQRFASSAVPAATDCSQSYRQAFPCRFLDSAIVVFVRRDCCTTELTKCCTTLNRVSITLKYICMDSLPGRIIGHPMSMKVTYCNQVISLYCLARDQELSNDIPSATGRSKPIKSRGATSRDGSSDEKAREIKHLLWTRRSFTDQGDSYRAPYKYTSHLVTNSTRVHGPQIEVGRLSHRDRASTPSQTRSSFPLKRVHLEECNPLHRRVHKVRKAIKNPKRSTTIVSQFSGNQRRVGIDSSHERLPVRDNGACRIFW